MSFNKTVREFELLADSSVRYPGYEIELQFTVHNSDLILLKVALLPYALNLTLQRIIFSYIECAAYVSLVQCGHCRTG